MVLKPKRPMGSYMMWLTASREQIKSENPGLKHTELSKKGGELWKAVDKSVWQEKAAKAKEQYDKDVAAYYARVGGVTQKLIKAKMMVKPKRPMSAFKMWLNASREQIKSENPGLNVTELDKKARKIWKKLDKSEWQEKVAKAREQFEIDMNLYYAHVSRIKQKLNKVEMVLKPKRPMGSYMMWLTASREQIKSENPGLKHTELSKKGGELWKAVDKSVWQEKAAKAKKQYDKDVAAYKATHLKKNFNFTLILSRSPYNLMHPSAQCFECVILSPTVKCDFSPSKQSCFPAYFLRGVT